MGTVVAAGSVPGRPMAVATDETNVFIGTDAGDIFKQVIATGAITKTGSIPEGITALAEEGTNLYIGTNFGRIYKQTIATGAISATYEAEYPGEAIASLAWDGTLSTIWAVTSEGNISKCTP